MEKTDFNEHWTVEVVGMMHKYRITNKELADRCKLASPYISTVLNGKKEFSSQKAKDRLISKIFSALKEIERERLENRQV